MQANSRFTIAIHICLFLKFKGEVLVSSQQIAESVKTNPVVIRRLVGNLRDTGIIKSVAGAKGGFLLNKPANKINLWDIYLAIRENDFFYKPKPNPECKVSSNLAVLVDDSYRQAELSMKTTLGKVTIADLNSRLDDILELQEEEFC